MEKNFHDTILAPALDLIKIDNKLKRFYFLPGLLSVVFMSFLLTYQIAYTYIVLLQKEWMVFEYILNLVHHTGYLSVILITVCVFVMLYIVANPVFEWALIRYIGTRDIKGPENASRSDALWLGFVRFYPLFEFNSIAGLFKFVSIFNGFLFSLRFLGLQYVVPLAIFFLIAFLFSCIINIFIAYARYEIILENQGVFPAIGVSSQIALLNLRNTLRIYLYMFFMNIKVFINFIIVMIFPIIGAGVAGFITSQVFSVIIITILILLFIFIIALLWYTTWVLNIFSTGIWYYSYKEGKKRLKEADHYDV